MSFRSKVGALGGIARVANMTAEDLVGRAGGLGLSVGAFGRATGALVAFSALMLSLPPAPATAVPPPPPAQAPPGTDGPGPPSLSSGFLGPEFIHETITLDPTYLDILDDVSPDTLGAVIQHLQDYGTRHTSSVQALHAGRWIVKRLVSYGYSDTLMQQIKIGDKVHLAPRNVIATKEGTTRPQFRIVIGGHYDSITFGESVPPEIEAPGADDNASGTAGTMEIARLVKDMELDATVQFVLFGAHEEGLYGSLEFARNLDDDGVPQDKLFFINLDMIGNADSKKPWKVTVYTDARSEPLAELMERVVLSYTDLLPLRAGNRYADQTSFQQHGYPAIFMHEADFSPNYHSRRDLLIHLEMDYEAEVVKAVLAMVLHLALVADPPDNPRACGTSTGGLRLDWDHSKDADLTGYQVELLDGQGRLIEKRATTDNFLTLNHSEASSVEWVRVRAEDVLGESEPSEPVFVGGGGLVVRGATPNPAATECAFDVFIPGSGDRPVPPMRILDASARLVRSIPLSLGSQTLRWDISSDGGESLPSGVYFFVVEIEGAASETGKIMVVR
jgi:hypothetical protein